MTAYASSGSSTSRRSGQLPEIRQDRRPTSGAGDRGDSGDSADGSGDSGDSGDSDTAGSGDVVSMTASPCLVPSGGQATPWRTPHLPRRAAAGLGARRRGSLWWTGLSAQSIGVPTCASSW
ncbi:hypothetical protein EUA07_17950 [Nocardioides ganghwensis]|uniref:Uncharacterized protein n=1 Tax=Nocardioides ganghwensis TaxID=252230 RepID=A0A4Q2SB37_9ACTN|nr:hypothetical protein EUA07_17950 [Nocardioides ganghwensis]